MNPGPELSVSGQEEKLIAKIVSRYQRLNPHDTRHSSSLQMDLVAVHANGNRLRLKDMLEGRDIDLVHDMTGIGRHLNRNTGKLEDFFSPRYSEHSS